MTDGGRHVVTAGEEGDRFDRVVARVADTSRAEARRLVESGAALLDGARAAPSTKLAEGSAITVTVAAAAAGLPAADVPHRIALEAPGYLVVDKPAGVVVHPGAGHHADTLVNGLVGAFPELRNMGPERNWGLVHRLDRDTSGLLLVARRAETHERLQRSLRRRQVMRRYWALAAGEFDNATGTIDAPVGRDPRRPTRMAVVAGGRASRTHYSRRAAWPERTLLDVTLETGRTHQIRVHLAAIGAPLVGDRTYGGPAARSGDLDRVWLHAYRLVFDDPDTDAPVDVRSPLPELLMAVLSGLGPPETGELPDEG